MVPNPYSMMNVYAGYNSKQIIQMQKTQGKKLTMDLIFTKTKSDRLQNIKNLNLWGNDLQDLSLIEGMPNLHVVSLSVNSISSLKDFAHCTRLQELYLRKNNIRNLSQIIHLTKLPNLKVLWLHDNPCAETKNYRQIVIKHLPNLAKLDNTPISPEERVQAQAITIDYHQVEQEDNRQVEQPTSQPLEPYTQQREERIRHTVHKPQSATYVPQPIQHQYPRQSDHKADRYQNILTAIMSLLPQLDHNSLEIVGKEVHRLFNS